MDVGDLDDRVLQMRGNHLDVVLVEGDQLEKVHDPAFVLTQCCRVGRHGPVRAQGLRESVPRNSRHRRPAQNDDAGRAGRSSPTDCCRNRLL